MVTKQRPTQQRVIDNVTISIEPSTHIGGGAGFSPELIRIDLGESGYGSVVLWVHRSEAHRLIGAIAQAMSVPAEPEPTPEGAETPAVAVAEPEGVPF